MSLVLKPTSKWWYGRPVVDGKRMLINLRVEVRGVRPKSLRELGDVAFERSRVEAQGAYDRRFAGPGHNMDAEYHRKMYELLTGRSLLERRPVPLDKLGDAWVALGRRRTPGPAWVNYGRAVFKEFAEFAQARGVSSARELDPELVRAWVASLAEETGARTVNFKLGLLRGLFKRKAREWGLDGNPFEAVVPMREETIHRRPFSQEELALIIAAADPIVRGPIITGICTAMRRADCCLLRPASVDLAAGFIQVRTNKTGEVAEIPILPMLAAELQRADLSGPYVWPAAALMARSNPKGLSWRVKKAIKTAGAVSRVERAVGRAASVGDFHSFRTTWITLALSAGVPMELVRRVTGHATVEVVLKHYFRPGRDAFSKAINGAMGRIGAGSA